MTNQIHISVHVLTCCIFLKCTKLLNTYKWRYCIATVSSKTNQSCFTFIKLKWKRIFYAAICYRINVIQTKNKLIKSFVLSMCLKWQTKVITSSMFILGIQFLTPKPKTTLPLDLLWFFLGFCFPDFFYKYFDNYKFQCIQQRLSTRKRFPNSLFTVSGFNTQPQNKKFKGMLHSKLYKKT